MSNHQGNLSAALDGYVDLYSIEAEMATLGSMLIDQSVIGAVRDILAQGDYYRPGHQVLFDVITGLEDRCARVDLLTVREELSSKGRLDEVGGIMYLTSLFDSVPSTANVEWHAQIVKDKSTRRDLVKAGLAVISAARDTADDIASVVERSQDAVLAVNVAKKDDRGPATMREIIPTVFDEMERAAEGGGQILSGLATGWHELDMLTGGYQEDDYVIICGDRGSGKTWTALWTIEHCAFTVGKGVYHVSQEMRRKRVGRRALATMSGVPSNVFRGGTMTADDWEKVNKGGADLYTDLWMVDDRASLRVSQIRQGVVDYKRRLERQGQELGLIVVDYLQLCKASGKYENKHQSISDISGGLREMAAELLVPVVALSQLTRSALKARDNKRPRPSDLAESGDIESDASLIIAPYREAFYDKQKQPDEATSERKIKEDEVEMIVLKSRDGESGTFFKTSFMPALGRYAPVRNTDIDEPTGF